MFGQPALPVPVVIPVVLLGRGGNVHEVTLAEVHVIRRLAPALNLVLDGVRDVALKILHKLQCSVVISMAGQSGVDVEPQLVAELLSPLVATCGSFDNNMDELD